MNYRFKFIAYLILGSIIAVVILDKETLLFILAQSFLNAIFELFGLFIIKRKSECMKKEEEHKSPIHNITNEDDANLANSSSWKGMNPDKELTEFVNNAATNIAMTGIAGAITGGIGGAAASGTMGAMRTWAVGTGVSAASYQIGSEVSNYRNNQTINANTLNQTNINILGSNNIVNVNVNQEAKVEINNYSNTNEINIMSEEGTIKDDFGDKDINL